jgi:hypothetical protein
MENGGVRRGAAAVSLAFFASGGCWCWLEGSLFAVETEPVEEVLCILGRGGGAAEALAPISTLEAALAPVEQRRAVPRKNKMISKSNKKIVSHRKIKSTLKPILYT